MQVVLNLSVESEFTCLNKTLVFTILYPITPFECIPLKIEADDLMVRNVIKKEETLKSHEVQRNNLSLAIKIVSTRFNCTNSTTTKLQDLGNLPLHWGMLYVN